MSDPGLYVSGVLNGIGVACGVTLCYAFFFFLLVGFGPLSLSSQIPKKLILLLAIFDVTYFQIKLPQMNSVNNDCGTQEALSVFFYLGSHVLLYIFFVARYCEVYDWDKYLWPVIALIVGFAVSIPISIKNNVTLVAEDGSCAVFHPPISAYLPSTLCFAISVYMLALFVAPLLSTTTEDRMNAKQLKTAQLVFLTSTVSIISTVLFHATLAVPEIEKYAPLTSSLDLMINYVMVCWPYISASLAKFYDAQITLMTDGFPRRTEQVLATGLHNECGVDFI
jgi:hypothetical protein